MTHLARRRESLYCSDLPSLRPHVRAELDQLSPRVPVGFIHCCLRTPKLGAGHALEAPEGDFNGLDGLGFAPPVSAWQNSPR